MAHIHCDTIENISWKKGNGNFIVADTTADVWRIKVGSDEKLHQFFNELLSKDEKQKAAKYHQEKDRERFVTARGALRFLIAGYLKIIPSDIQFVLGPNKKPLLSSHHNLHFNTSHSGDWILISIAGTEIGVDVEKINKHFSYNEIIELNFSKEEKEFIQNSAEPEKDFYLLWTRKEALVKATGKGVDNDLGIIPSLDGSHENKFLRLERAWNVSSFIVDEQYVGSVAISQKITTINLLESPALFFLQPV
jgi:4'-phosphopantetheinyl transferase